MAKPFKPITKIPVGLHQSDPENAAFLQTTIDNQKVTNDALATISFQNLTDGFKFAGHASQSVRVNAGASALEPFTPAQSVTSFTTPQITLTPSLVASSNSTFQYAHGLTGTPTKVAARLICLTAQNGYSIGDTPFVTPVMQLYTYVSGGTTFVVTLGTTIWCDATNVNGMFAFGVTGGAGATSALYAMMDRTAASGNFFLITNADWALLVTVDL